MPRSTWFVLGLALVFEACAPREPPATVEVVPVPSPALPQRTGSTPRPAAAAPPPAAPTAEASQAPAADDPDDTADLREATFRHMFAKNASGQQQKAKVYCLELEGSADPPPSFLERFKDVGIAVRPASQCTMGSSGVFDKKTHASGLSFRIDKIVRKDENHAEVEGGYYEAGLSASGNVYTLERRQGAWTVTGDRMLWIS